MLSRERLLEDLESGRFETLLQLTSEEAHRAQSLDLVVLTHALAGELEQTLWHCSWLKDNHIQLSKPALAAINFALGVAYTRVSEYAQARHHFAKNRRFRHSDTLSRFYVYQGIGFYRFFCGHYRKASIFAKKAFECAMQGKNKFGQLLAEELLAHAMMEEGQIRRGIYHLREALNKARALNNSSLRQTFRLLVLLSEARFGLNWNSLPKLEKALARLHPQDSYSRNAVKLELANQLALRGQPGRAIQVLDEACASIYASRNRRHIALLGFRLAYLTWMRGRGEEALRLLKSTELHLHQEVDVALARRMRGLERRLNGEPYQRVRDRQVFGEDPLGDLYDRVSRKDPTALTTILKERLFYFLFPYFDLEFEKQALIFDLLPKGVILLDRGEIRVIEKGLTRVLRRILELLAQSHRTKEELVTQVWGYEYDPPRHDPLIYTSISKLRQVLGCPWIEADEKGYRLKSGVQLQMQRGSSETSPGPKISESDINLTKTTLSFRQLRILAAFDKRKRENLGVEDVMRAFAVSRATATRDLTALTEEGLLIRLGRARATRYIRGNV